MVMICPLCRSSNVDVWLGRGSGNMYKYLDCGFQGAFFIETEDEDIKKLKNTEKRSRQS